MSTTCYFNNTTDKKGDEIIANTGSVMKVERKYVIHIGSDDEVEIQLEVHQDEQSNEEDTRELEQLQVDQRESSCEERTDSNHDVVMDKPELDEIDKQRDDAEADNMNKKEYSSTEDYPNLMDQLEDKQELDEAIIQKKDKAEDCLKAPKRSLSFIHLFLVASLAISFIVLIDFSPMLFFECKNSTLHLLSPGSNEEMINVSTNIYSKSKASKKSLPQKIFGSGLNSILEDHYAHHYNYLPY